MGLVWVEIEYLKKVSIFIFQHLFFVCLPLLFYVIDYSRASVFCVADLVDLVFIAKSSSAAVIVS